MQFSESKTASMSAEVQKVLVKIPEKGNFEGYFGSFIHDCIYSLESVLTWPCKLMVSRRYFTDYLW